MSYYRTLLAVGSNLLKDIVAYYKLDGNVNDSSPNALNGTFGTSNTFSAGKIGNAINMTNNVNSFATISDSNLFSFTDGVNDKPFSISCWVKMTVSKTTGHFLVSKARQTTTNSEWVLFVFNQKIRFFISSPDQTKYIYIESISSLSINTYYHLTATYDGSKSASGMKLYLDGVQISTQTFTLGVYTGMTNGIEPVRFGVYTNGSILNNLVGQLDETGIWSRVLSQNDVNELYNSGNGKTLF